MRSQTEFHWSCSIYVVNGTCHTTNIKFKIDVTELSSRDLQIDKVYLINDLEATAFGMTEMDDEFMDHEKRKSFYWWSYCYFGSRNRFRQACLSGTENI